MLSLAAVLRGIDPATIGSYQIEAIGTMVSGNSVLQAQLGSEAKQSILATFRGLTSAPVPAALAPAATAVGSDVNGDILRDPNAT